MPTGLLDFSASLDYVDAKPFSEQKRELGFLATSEWTGNLFAGLSVASFLGESCGAR